MDTQTLKKLINGDTTALALFQAGNDTDCAARCVAIAPKAPQATMMTYRLLAAATGIGIPATRRLVISMQAVAATDPLIAEMGNYLTDNSPTGGIDISDPGTQTMLSEFARLNTTNGLTAADVMAIEALCMVPQVITDYDVSLVRAAG